MQSIPKRFSQDIHIKFELQQESMSKVLYTINPKKYPQFKLKKELIRKQTLELNPNQANIEDSFSENLSHIKLNKSEETEETHPLTLITFTEPSQIDYDKKRKHRRVRNFKKYTNEDYIKHSKWKVKEGIERQEGKIHIILQKDLRFQYDYIKDELKVLIENIQYLKSNLLSSNDILSAFKKKDLCYQTSTNIIIEETCALLEEIAKYILCDYYEYSACREILGQTCFVLGHHYVKDVYNAVKRATSYGKYSVIRNNCNDWTCRVASILGYKINVKWTCHNA